MAALSLVKLEPIEDYEEKDLQIAITDLGKTYLKYVQITPKMFIVLKMKDKVVFYLEEHQIEERVREHKVRISRTKSEDVFHPLKNKDSLTYKFLESVAKDKVLRQLFFLNFDVNFSYDQLYPVELTFPIFLTSQDDFIKKTENDMFKEKMNFIMSEVERTQEELENLSHSTFVDFISSMMADPAFLKIFKSRKIHGMEETIREILEKHKDRFEEVVAKSLDIFGKTMYVAELTRLNNALEKMVLAQANFEILSQAIKMPDEAEYFFDSLTKLPKHDVSMLSLTSICLECKLRYDKNTYYLSEKMLVVVLISK